jgi:hypothetical protein
LHSLPVYPLSYPQWPSAQTASVALFGRCSFSCWLLWIGCESIDLMRLFEQGFEFLT